MRASVRPDCRTNRELDPMSYYFKGFLALAYMVAGSFRDGMDYADQAMASGMASSLHLPFSRAFRDPIATRYIRSRLATSMPGR